MNDLISRQDLLDKFEPWLKVKDYNDGELNMLKAILYEIRFMPPATDKNVGTKLVIDPYKIERAIRGLTEWQKHVQTVSDIDRDISVAVEALKAQLGTNLAEVGTDRAVKGFPIDADDLMLRVEEKYGFRSRDRLYDIIRKMPKYELPSAEPKRGKWEWIEEHGRYECSECGEQADDLIMGYPRWDFCPNCGADMKEVTT